MSKNKHMPEPKRLVTACALPKKKAGKKKKKAEWIRAYLRSRCTVNNVEFSVIEVAVRYIQYI